jgi:hypothetical protein
MEAQMAVKNMDHRARSLKTHVSSKSGPLLPMSSGLMQQTHHQ